MRGAGARPVGMLRDSSLKRRSVLLRLLRDFLVPAAPCADFRAHLPAEGLRRRLDGFEEFGDAVLKHAALILADRGERAEMLRHPLQIGGEGVVEAPVLAHHIDDVIDVDRLWPRLLIRERVLEHEHDRVFEVFQVDLDDLHLLQQQVGRADRRAVEIEPILERDAVTEIELVGEHVDVETRLAVQIGVARPFRGHVDPLVGNVAPRREEFADGAVLLLLGPKIDVGQNTLGVLEQVQILRALQAIGDRTQNSQADALFFRIADEIERLVDEFEIETWIGRHLSQIGLLGLRVRSHGV